MEAKELRVGNWVSTGKVVAVSERDNEIMVFDGVAYWRTSVMSDDWLQPIPLTPEILEKCGFEYENLYDWVAMRYFIGDFELIGYHGDEEYFTFNQVCFHSSEAINYKIEYLHQLQNLFYILVGQELTINL